MTSEPVIVNRRMAYRENPFWSETKVEVKGKRVTVGTGAYVTEDGERIEAAGIHKVEKVDSEQFVKLYTGKMRAIFELKPSAQKVLQYLISEIQKTPNVDGVYLNWFSAEQYISENEIGNMSRTSFQRAMNELVEKRFIAPSHLAHMFWFNPAIMWNGNRMRFVEEYILES